MSDVPAEEMIEYLVATRFLVRGFGTVTAGKDKQSPESLRVELQALDYKSLKARYDAFVSLKRKRAEAEEAAHPFNQPAGRADFDHWAKMEYWTVDEGIALLLGRSPAFLAWDRVKHIQSSPVVLQFGRIREAARRAVHWKGLHEGNRPGAFLLWAKRFEYSLPVHGLRYQLEGTAG